MPVRKREVFMPFSQVLKCHRADSGIKPPWKRMEEDASMLAMDSGGQRGIRLHLVGILRFLYNLKVERYSLKNAVLQFKKKYSGIKCIP